jgi:hypothetical protein
LASDPKTDLQGLSRSQKNIIRRQPKKFSMSKEGAQKDNLDDGCKLNYPEVDAREEILQATHVYALLIRQSSVEQYIDSLSLSE